MEQCMSAMRGDLTENTDATRQIANDTAFIRAAWADGVSTIRFFCRLAAAWRFLLRSVVVPVLLPASVFWAFLRIVHHESLPDWVSACVKLIVAWL